MVAFTVRPGEGFAGNHIYVTDGLIAFDFHGYSSRLRLLDHHTNGWADRYGTGWHCRLECVDFSLLSTTDLNQRKMLGPDQYGGDVISRVRAFIGRVDHQRAAAKARRIALPASYGKYL